MEKLSEYIRYGASITGRASSVLITKDDDSEEIYCTCALGAACFAKNQEATLDVLERDDTESLTEITSPLAYRLFPELSDLVTYADDTQPLGRLIIQLNDGNSIDREDIADIVAELGY